jgi:hypothetical protein
MTDPELSLMLEWQQVEQQNKAWAELYDGYFDQAILYLEQSRGTRDAALLAEKEEGRRKLRRARGISAILGFAFVVALGLAIFAFVERSTAIIEPKAGCSLDHLPAASDLVEFGFCEFVFRIVARLLRAFVGVLLVVAHVDLLVVRLAGFSA